MSGRRCAPVQYSGPAIKSTLVYLTQGQLLPMKRTAQILSDLFGVKLSAGSVHTSIVQASQTLVSSVMQIAAAVIASPVVHFDETGQRVSGRLRWLHSAGTPLLTWYGAHDKRGKIAMDEFGILPAFQGVAVHDGWASYRDYACTHGLCNAHHLRELIFLEETTQQTWPRKMIELLLRAKEQADAAKLAQRPVPSEQINAVRRRYKAILAQGEADNPRLARAKIKQRGKGARPLFLLFSQREIADAGGRWNNIRVRLTGTVAMHPPKWLCLLLVLPALACGAAHAQRTLSVAPAAVSEQRVALVIGNAAYKEAPLRNPVNDASDMAAELRRLGFAVTLRTNAGPREMRAAIREFSQRDRRFGNINDEA